MTPPEPVIRDLLTGRQRKIRPPKPKEIAVHGQVIDLLRLSAHRDVLFFHIPNGEFRRPVTGRRLKRMGQLNGVADLLLIRNCQPYFLELKRPGGKNRLTDDQKNFRKAAWRAGAAYAVADSLEAATKILKGWRILRTEVYMGEAVE